MNEDNEDIIYNDTSKVTKLRNSNEEIKYTVILTDFNQEIFYLRVLEHCDSLKPIEIVKQKYRDEELATKAYEKMIEDYSAIILLDEKKETIAESIFEEAIDYHITNPKRCLSCKFCRKLGVTTFNQKCVCDNDDNIHAYNNFLRTINKGHEIATAYEVIHPIIHPDGICKNYAEIDERAFPPKKEKLPPRDDFPRHEDFHYHDDRNYNKKPPRRR